MTTTASAGGERRRSVLPKEPHAASSVSHVETGAIASASDTAATRCVNERCGKVYLRGNAYKRLDVGRFKRGYASSSVLSTADITDFCPRISVKVPSQTPSSNSVD